MKKQIVDLESERLARRAADPDNFSWVFRVFPGHPGDDEPDDYLCIFTRRLLERVKAGLGVEEQDAETTILNLASGRVCLDDDLAIFRLAGVAEPIAFVTIDLDGRGTLHVLCLAEEAAEIPASIASAIGKVRAACREAARQDPMKRWTR